MSEIGALSQAWVAAEAAMPFGWALDGLMPGWVFSQTDIGESGAAEESDHEGQTAIC